MQTEKSLWLGFPAAAEPTYPVQVKVYPTSTHANAENTTWLTSPKVTIQRTKDGNDAEVTEVASVFSASSDSGTAGLLSKDGTVVADDNVTGSGILKLPAGEYSYTVEPVEADVNLYSAFSGTFTVNASSDKQVKDIYAQSKTSAAPRDYLVRLLDGESYGGAAPFPQGARFDVTVAGGAKQTLAVDANGCITINTTSGTGKELKVERAGYVPLNYLSGSTNTLGLVDFNEDGTISANGFKTVAARAVDPVNTVKVEQQYTNVTLTVEELPAYITIDKAVDGKVTENMSTQLPMIVPVTNPDTKQVTVSLPDGDYVYTVVSPAHEDVEKKLDVANTGLQNGEGDTTTGKVIISDPDGSNSSELTVTDNAVTADNTETGTANTEITDPLYYAVGEWKKNAAQEVTGMEVKVYLKNVNATVGTFGMQYDAGVFALDSTVTMNSGIVLEKLTLPGGSTALENPAAGANYHLFQWRAKDETSIDASTAPVLLATYTLNFASGVTNDNYKDKITATTLTSLAFSGSSWYTAAQTHYSGDATGLKDFTDQYWRPVDAANTAPAAAPRLNADKAVNGGFYQTFAAGDETAEGRDTRSQFVYETFGGATSLQFVVTSDGTTPVKNATVTVKEKGTETVLGTGVTDESGKISIPVPKGDVSYVITANGYVDTKADVASDKLGEVQKVTMVANVSHNVEIFESQALSTELVGGKAYNGQDYFFNLNERPGYHWSPGLPAPGDLTIKMVTKDKTFNDITETIAATWDAATNRYKVAGADIKDNSSDSKLVIQLKAEKAPVENDTQEQSPTVTVHAGAHGSFDYADDATIASTFTGDATEATGSKVHDIVETLGIKEAVSAKYSFASDGPVDENNTTAQSNGEPYEAYVIYKFIVNGTEMSLTDHERITGVKNYQLTNVSSDQTISVLFGTATIDGNGTPDTGDDIIDGPVTPVDNTAVVSLILSDYGSANTIQVNGAAANPDTLTGSATQNYPVDTTAPASFSAVFAGTDSVTQPDGSSVKYVVDAVMVNGTPVNGESADSRWDSANSKLTLTGLTSGEAVTVVVTFKPEGKESVFAAVELVRRAGDGTVTPLGTSLWTVGLPANFALAPTPGSDLDQLDLLEADASAPVDVTEHAVKNESGNVYTYQTPNLKTGTTVLGYGFRDSAAYHLNLTIQYTVSVTPGSAATVTFTRATDGVKVVYGPGQVGAYHLDKPTGPSATYDFELPAGTWNIKVTKHGYLDYTINGFVIAEGGATAGYVDSMETKVETGVEGKGTVITFGQKSAGETSARAVKLTIGDATWDGGLVALNDIAQVANGLLATATAGQKERADLDESGSVLASDMTYVVNSYGARSVTRTYADLMAETLA